MNNEIQKFDFKGAPLRTLTDKAGEPWFVAKDVCDILGTDTRDLHKILESDEITNVDSIHIAQNGGKAPLIISEPGLYRLVMKSRKPEAKEFQRWVTHEVLPSIRKHGGYMAGQERMTPEQMALASMRWLQSKVDEQAKQLKAQEGKVLFANAVETARTSILVGDFAKILKSNGIDIGPRRQTARPRHRPMRPIRIHPLILLLTVRPARRECGMTPILGGGRAVLLTPPGITHAKEARDGRRYDVRCAR